MATLYAWYRRVPFLFVKTMDYTITDANPESPLPDFPEFLKYTYVLKWCY